MTEGAPAQPAPPQGDAAQSNTNQTQAAPTEPESERLKREMAELRAQIAAITAAARASPSAVEADLRRQLADATAQIASASSSAPVADHLAREALYRREPHRAVLQRNRARLDGYAADLGSDAAAHDTLYREFASAARARAISATDALLLHSLLAPLPFRLRLARALLLNSSSTTRAQLFNTLVLGLAPPLFEDAHGEVVSQIPWPLFPVRAEFAELNSELLREAAAILEGNPVTGAGPPRPQARTPAVFATTSAGEGAAARRMLDVVRGAGYAPISEHGADLKEVEDAFNWLVKEVENLKAQVSTFRSQPRPRQNNNNNQSNRNTANNRNNNNTNYNNNSSNNRPRNNNYNNNYNYNNRGPNYNSQGYRVRGGGPGEEDTEEGNP